MIGQAAWPDFASSCEVDMSKFWKSSFIFPTCFRFRLAVEVLVEVRGMRINANATHKCRNF